MVGDLEKSSFSNIEQQSLEFVKYTLDPWVVRWEQSLSRSLLSEDEKKVYFFKFKLEGLLRGDYQSRMNGYAIARQNGWMSANDIRELEDLDKLTPEQGGDSSTATLPEFPLPPNCDCQASRTLVGSLIVPGCSSTPEGAAPFAKNLLPNSSVAIAKPIALTAR